MVEFRRLLGEFLRRNQETDFDVQTGDFDSLIVREAEGFSYFYESSEGRLIKNFLLRTGPQVDTLCGVVLVESNGHLSPKLHFWKRDKTNSKTFQASVNAMSAGEPAALVKASVDLDDCLESLLKLIDFLRTFEGVELTGNAFPLAVVSSAALVDVFKGHSTAEILSAVKVFAVDKITERDFEMLIDRRETLSEFEQLLHDDEYFESTKKRLGVRGNEAVWQRFFEDHQWIFGYGLNLVACESVSESGLEAITTGANIFSGAGKRIDAVMRTRGFIQSLLFAEIKTHRTNLLKSTQYRPPDVYQVSDELSGAVSQVQKTTHKAVSKLLDLHRNNTSEGDFEFEVSTVRPRQVVVIGHLGELAPEGEINVERLTNFELYRRSQHEVEIITFDELLERARFITENTEKDAE